MLEVNCKSLEQLGTKKMIMKKYCVKAFKLFSKCFKCIFTNVEKTYSFENT